MQFNKLLKTKGFYMNKMLKVLFAMALVTLMLDNQAFARGKSSKSEKAEAKKQCLAQDSKMTGKKLKKCIKGITKK